jgi:hypothetical protein
MMSIAILVRMSTWVVLVHRIPPRPLYFRAKIRQRLEQVGAIALKNSVYLLPQRPETVEDLQWIAQEVAAGGGESHLFTADFLDPAQDRAARARFDAARAADYEALVREARSALKAARGSSAAAALAPEHAKLARRLLEVGRLDFFASDRRRPAQAALRALEARLRRGREEETRMLKAHPGLRGKVWVTRPHVKVDRLASAWFIRRFVDPRARFRFADPSAAPREGELRFDMVGGDFTHEGDRCTLETLVRRVGLPDRGVKAIGEIVHDLDLKDEKYGRAEAAGVGALVEGLVARCDRDEDRIEQGLRLFDDLHQALGGRRRSS